MKTPVTKTIITHSFSPVKPRLNTHPPLLPGTVIHHKTLISLRGHLIVSYSKCIEKSYGVSSAAALLPGSLFIKKNDLVKAALKRVVGLTDCHVEVIIRLLRLQSYYGVAYPKASQIAGERQPSDPAPFIPYPGYVSPKRHHWGTSRATFWRAIARLKELGLVTVVNRYVLREHAQISNLYQLDQLLVLIAKYLAEHTGRIWPGWFDRYLFMPWPQFWAEISVEGDISSRGSPPLSFQ